MLRSRFEYLLAMSCLILVRALVLNDPVVRQSSPRLGITQSSPEMGVRRNSLGVMMRQGSTQWRDTILSLEVALPTATVEETEEVLAAVVPEAGAYTRPLFGSP
jgi:hypothetical protein